MAAYRTPPGFTATPCFPTGPTFGTRATTVCGGSETSARLRQRMEYIWLDFWTTRDRSSFLFLRRATRLRRELYEVLGVCKFTWLARLRRGSSVTHMNLEAPPWTADFRFSASLVHFFLSFSWTCEGVFVITSKCFPSFRVRKFTAVNRCVSGQFFLGLGWGGFCVFCPA